MSVSAKHFAQRRKRLMRTLGKGAVVILPAALEKIRNRDSHYPYRQDSDFHYLTGFPEPEAVAVLSAERYALFCRPRDPKLEVWTGARVGQDGAVSDYSADEAHAIADLDQLLPQWLENSVRLYWPTGIDAAFDARVMAWVHTVRRRGRSGVRAPMEYFSLDAVLHEMRLIKSTEEAALMRRAAQVSAQGHVRAMQGCRPGLMEYQLEAELLHEFVRQGCRYPSYNPIVGGGANACVLHYNDNNAPLHDGDLVLIDAGAECEHYAGDVTRTFPVNGRFSPAQRAVYEVVLAAQTAAIACVRPGAHWHEPHEAAVRVLTEGMVELGLLKGRVPRLIQDEAYQRFYMHRTGHWLGMDVHDVGEYRQQGEWRPLVAGMALTVEPGLYISPECKSVPRRYRGIGVRIEDDVLVTRTGCEVLSHAAPKTVAEIEALVGSVPLS